MFDFIFDERTSKNFNENFWHCVCQVCQDSWTERLRVYEVKSGELKKHVMEGWEKRGKYA